MKKIPDKVIEFFEKCYKKLDNRKYHKIVVLFPKVISNRVVDIEYYSIFERNFSVNEIECRGIFRFDLDEKERKRGIQFRDPENPRSYANCLLDDLNYRYLRNPLVFPETFNLFTEEIAKADDIWKKTGLKEFCEFLKTERADETWFQSMLAIYKFFQMIHFKENRKIELLLKAGYHKIAYLIIMAKESQFQWLKKPTGLLFDSVKELFPLSKEGKELMLSRIDTEIQSMDWQLQVFLAANRARRLTTEEIAYIFDEFQAEVKEIYDLCPKKKYTSRESNHLLELIDYGYDLPRLLQYFQRCYDYQGLFYNKSAQLLIDTVRMARTFNLPYEKYTCNLVKDHDMMVKQFNLLNYENKNKFFSNKLKELQWLSYRDDEFAIVVPQTGQDLVVEGRELHHCVGSYTNAIAEGKSVIVFLRQISNPNKPYFTIELNRLCTEVVQFRGLNNCACHDSKAKRFVDKWMKHVLRNRPINISAA